MMMMMMNMFIIISHYYHDYHYWWWSSYIFFGKPMDLSSDLPSWSRSISTDVPTAEVGLPLIHSVRHCIPSWHLRKSFRPSRPWRKKRMAKSPADQCITTCNLWAFGTTLTPKRQRLQATSLFRIFPSCCHVNLLAKLLSLARQPLMRCL